MNILTVFGTRPEAIKMAPLVKALKDEPSVRSLVCVTGQHREMLGQVLQLFGIVPDFDLSLMIPNQTLNALSARVLGALDAVLEELQPDRMLVHGDTTQDFYSRLYASVREGVPLLVPPAEIRNLVALFDACRAQTR